jgi:hypothetical protein
MADIASPRFRLLPVVLGTTIRVVMLPIGLAMLGGVFLARKTGLGGVSDRTLRKAMDLPVLPGDPSASLAADTLAEVDALLLAGNWSGLHDRIAAWDAARAALRDDRRKGRIALNHALAPLRAVLGDPAAAKTAQTLLDAFDARLAADPDHPVAAILAAFAHMDAGWAARGGGWASGLSDEARDRFQRHFARADAILEDFDPAAFALPLLAEAHYRLCPGLPDGADRLRDTHDDWADLDPSDPEVWVSHGFYLLPRWFGSHAEVAAAAARCEWQTERWLGKGGYALFLMPVLTRDAEVWASTDPERLAAAILDLARHRRKDQVAINALAAQIDTLIDLAPPDHETLLRTTRRQLLEETLNTLVPSAWGMAELAARRRIADAFLPELRAGARLRATPAGIALCDGTAA